MEMYVVFYLQINTAIKVQSLTSRSIQRSCLLKHVLLLSINDLNSTRDIKAQEDNASFNANSSNWFAIHTIAFHRDHSFSAFWLTFPRTERTFSYPKFDQVPLTLHMFTCFSSNTRCDSQCIPSRAVYLQPDNYWSTFCAAQSQLLTHSFSW